MPDNAEAVNRMLETIKLSGAVLLLLVGVVGFYYFGDASTLYRVLALLAVAGVAVGIIMTTQPGQGAWSFLQESRTEVRKVVWPSRQETVQTTLIVIAVVILIGIFLWLVDMFLGWAVQLFIGQRG